MAYVLWYFPKLSETFVVEELLALADLGIEPLVIARERPDDAIENRRADPLLARTIWLRDKPALARAAVAARVAARHPVRLLACLRVVVASRSRWALLNLYFGLLLAAEIERRDLRYVHAHMADNAAEMAYVAARLTGVPWGVTVHAVDIYLGRFLCEKLASASVRVTVCEYNVGQIQQRCPAVSRDEFVIKYAGLDAREFRLERPRPERAAREILAVGRLTPKKGFDQLVAAVAVLTHEGRDVHCRIVGEGEPWYADKLDAAIAEHGLGGVITIEGALTPDQIRQHLADADVLAAPCTIASWGDRDSMPVVIKEAMAMELPVVASDDFGIPEMVSADAGILFPRDDVAALTDALRSVLDLPPAARAAMGRAGRKVVVERFDESVGARLLAEQFAPLLGQGQEVELPG